MAVCRCHLRGHGGHVAWKNRYEQRHSIHRMGRGTHRCRLAGFWLLAFAGVRIAQLTHDLLRNIITDPWLPDRWLAVAISILLAEGAAAVIAFRFRAAIAAYVVLGFVAMMAARGLSPFSLITALVVIRKRRRILR